MLFKSFCPSAHALFSKTGERPYDFFGSGMKFSGFQTSTQRMNTWTHEMSGGWMNEIHIFISPYEAHQWSSDCEGFVFRRAWHCLREVVEKERRVQGKAAGDKVSYCLRVSELPPCHREEETNENWPLGCDWMKDSKLWQTGNGGRGSEGGGISGVMLASR